MSRSRTKGAVNPGCRQHCGECALCASALPYGASCAASCVHVDQCKADYGIKGSEGACRFVPSQFTPARALSLAVELELSASEERA